MTYLADIGYGTIGVSDPTDRPPGRHALNEDAVQTPIFHALATGRVRPAGRTPAPRGEPAADPVELFRRDPLTAPIPAQALVTVSSLPMRLPEPATDRGHYAPHRIPAPHYRHEQHHRLSGGRHHRRLEIVPG